MTTELKAFGPDFLVQICKRLNTGLKFNVLNASRF